MAPAILWTGTLAGTCMTQIVNTATMLSRGIAFAGVRTVAIGATMFLRCINFRSWRTTSEVTESTCLLQRRREGERHSQEGDHSFQIVATLEHNQLIAIAWLPTLQSNNRHFFGLQSEKPDLSARGIYNSLTSYTAYIIGVTDFVTKAFNRIALA